MPGSLPATFDFAKSKAQTAVALGVPTDALSKKLPQYILSNITSTQGGKYVLCPGGYPVRVGKQIVAGFAFGSTIVAIDSNLPNNDTPCKMLICFALHKD